MSIVPSGRIPIWWNHKEYRHGNQMLRRREFVAAKQANALILHRRFS
jgi:hypothetical protein